VLWAYAKLGERAPPLFWGARRAVKQMARSYEFAPWSLATTVWAYATVKHRCPEVRVLFFLAAQKRSIGSEGVLYLRTKSSST